jgi:hypothetical protein
MVMEVRMHTIETFLRVGQLRGLSVSSDESHPTTTELMALESYVAGTFPSSNGCRSSHDMVVSVDIEFW